MKNKKHEGQGRDSPSPVPHVSYVFPVPHVFPHVSCPCFKLRKNFVGIRVKRLMGKPKFVLREEEKEFRQYASIDEAIEKVLDDEALIYVSLKEVLIDCWYIPEEMFKHYTSHS